jgi:hypothetical protein
MDGDRALRLEDLVWIEHAAGEASAARDALEARLRAKGISVAATLDASVTVIVRTRAAIDLAALLGDSPSAAIIARMGRTHAVRWLDEDAALKPPGRPRTDAPHEEFSRESLRASASEPEEIARAVRRLPAARLPALASELGSIRDALDARCALAVLQDPRLHDRSARARLSSALAAMSDPEAFAWLAEAMRAHRGEAGPEEAIALGRLLGSARGRWPASSPFAIELDDPQDELSDPLRALFAEAGRYQRLHDERGATVHRAVIGPVPRIDDEATESSAPLRLLRAICGLASARVWVGGIALPGDLPWPLWCALLGQRPRR